MADGGSPGTSREWGRTRFAGPIVALAPFALAVFALAGPALAAFGPTAAPWAPGDQVGGWEVTDVRSHPEFLRVFLTRDGAETAFEVVREDGGPGPFASERHRVQPAPDAANTPDEALLQAAVPTLAAWERTLPDDAGPTAHGSRAEPRSDTLLRDALASPVPLALTGIVLLALVTLRLRRLPRDQRRPLAAGAGAVVLVLVAARALPAALVPTAWVTPLHEGGTEYLLQVLHGEYANAGPFFGAVKAVLAGPPDGLALLAVVRMNVALWLLTAGLLAALVAPRLGRLAFVAPALLLVAEPLGLHAAFSELPAATFGVLAMLLALVFRWTLEPAASRAERAVGLAAAALLTLDVALTRLELAPIAAAAVAAVIAQRLGRRGGRWAALFDPPPRSRWRRWLGPIVLLGAVVAAVALLEWIPYDGEGFVEWMLRAWRPSRGGWQDGAGLLVGTLPLGLVVLIAVGLVEGLRRPLATGGLALTVPFVLLLYVAQWGWGYFVQYRYLVVLWPAIVLLVLVGAAPFVRAFERLATRGPHGRALAVAAATLGVVAVAAPRFQGLRVDAIATEPAAPFQLMACNKQREARFLVDWLRTHPDSTLLTRASLPPHTEADRGTRCGPVVFGADLPRPLDSRSPADAIRAAATAAETRGGGLLCYRGLDANLVLRDDCELAPADDAAVLASARWPSRQIVAGTYQGAEEETITVAIYRCDPGPLLAPPVPHAPARHP